MIDRFLKWILISAVYLGLPWLVYGQTQTGHKENIFIVAYSEDLFTGVNLNDVQVAVDMWTNELEKGVNKKLGTILKGKSIFIKKDADIRASLLRSHPDLLTISALSYLKIRSLKRWVPIFCGGGVSNVPGKSLYLLIKKNSHYSSLKDLRGKAGHPIKEPIRRTPPETEADSIANHTTDYRAEGTERGKTENFFR